MLVMLLFCGFVCLLLFLGAFYGSYAVCLLCWVCLCLIYVADYVGASLCLLGFWVIVGVVCCISLLRRLGFCLI